MSVVGENAYHAEFLVANVDMWHSLMRRDRLVREYSYAVPTRAALDAVLALGPIFEAGAGTGYWAGLLRERGGDVVACEVHPPELGENGYHSRAHVRGPGDAPFRPRTWSPIVAADARTEVGRHNDRALFLCWPPYAEPFADEVLRAYGGSRLAYIGEPSGGCTGDDAFYERLDREWDLQQLVELPQWYGVHDDLYIYGRRCQVSAVYGVERRTR